MRRRSIACARSLPILLACGIWLASSTSATAQIAVGKPKFLGSAMGSSAPSNFSTYWNQVTPENSTKWASVEGTRNQMNWSQAQMAYDYALSRGFKFKGHTLIWGSQFPSWLSGLSQQQQRAEIEEWIRLTAQQFPQMWAIDVVNEPIKTPLPWKAALGGDGATGWDWVITAFQLARQQMPNVKLLINEYGTENDPNARNQYLTIINLLRQRGLLDGIGVQAHYFNLDSMNASQMTTALNAYAATGLDIYISELDITGGGSDSGQLAKYQDLFPVMWNHSNVKGITLWGYIVGQTWRDGTGIVNSNGMERPAMTWLKSFVAGTPGGGGGGVWLEAERGTVGATWNDNIPDSAASSGQYVTVQPGNNSINSAPTTAAGWVQLPFNVSQAGTYRVWIRRKTPNANDDSFWVRMDNGSFAMWNNIPVASSWAWAQYPSTFNLGAGSHTLTFGYREDGAQLDKVYITSGTDTPSGTGGTPNN
jgi:GH35 family endo-1,4-beta-xylanase